MNIVHFVVGVALFWACGLPQELLVKCFTEWVEVRMINISPAIPSPPTSAREDGSFRDDGMDVETDTSQGYVLNVPRRYRIKFNKDVTLNGFQSFLGNVIVKDFLLPSDNPAGGIDFVAVNNPSPFKLNLGTIVFALTYKGVDLGLGTSNNPIIAPGNNIITLKGVLQNHTDSNELAALSELFTNYLNSKETHHRNGAGLQALNLNVPLAPPSPINPIRAISIGNFDLAFSDETP
ncbi:hypothetical protein MKEN_01083300 [Mycena kentingensis (nom. inval.)]|nr:hypothetical protein MKEN_01083300 [Mycena kentingensis (nom. inval.)]